MTPIGPAAPDDSQEEGLRRELDEERTARRAEQAVGRRRRVRAELELDRARAHGRAQERALRDANALLSRRLVRWAVELHARADAVRLRIRAERARRGRRPAARDPTVIESAGRTIAIHIVPETWDVAASWGDTIFASDLKAAFVRKGWDATVHVRSEIKSKAAVNADVALYLFGLDAPRPRNDQLSLLWIISHPDRVTARMLEPFHAVFVASRAFHAELAPRVRPPVHELLQATDPGKFFPDPTGPRHKLLFVGNSRDRRRPALDALASTGHDLAVYGRNWRPELTEMRFVRGEWIDNDELRRYYSAADIVLADHWEDMRDEGFIANRVFDALACGAFVISDRVRGIDDVFDDAVPTFDDPAELSPLVDRYLADPAAREELAARGRTTVLERHTFDHRAEAIIAEIERIRGAPNA
jgi:hypothetical protein